MKTNMKPESNESATGAEVVTADGRSLPLIGAKLRGHATGGLARLVLEQTLENRHAETLRVTYRMPLPAGGAVSGYAFTIADRVIRGQVDRKAAARARFEAAVAQGKTAALLEQERADIFTQEIGNLPAGETLVATITIDQRLAWLPEGEWELRFPTVIGPRYVTNEADAKATRVDVATTGLAARVAIEIAIGDKVLRKPSSPTHKLVVREDGSVELVDPARLDRDLVVRWPVATAAVGLALDCARAKAGSHGLLTITPPARDAKVVAVARDLIVLLDTSGSMGGAPLTTAKQVVGLLIDSLDERDRLELIEFSSTTRRYKGEPVHATAREKQDAITWVKSRTASGGTEMYSGVLEALTTLRIGAQRQVVVVTDGYIGGEHQIVRLLHDKLPASCRLHVLGVGSAVNQSLAMALARAGRGAEVLVGPDEDPERGAKRLLDRTRRPILTNLELGGRALVAQAPEHMPDVFEGAPIVAALALRPEGGELTLRGVLADGIWEQTLRVPARAEGEGNQAVVALYGRERVADLETRAVIDEDVDGEIETIGLEFQISTRLTSWLAIDDSRRTVGPSRDEAIPQELPYGTSAASFGLRGASEVAAINALSSRAGGYAANTMRTQPAEKSVALSALTSDQPDTGKMKREVSGEIRTRSAATPSGQPPAKPSVMHSVQPSAGPSMMQPPSEAPSHLQLPPGIPLQVAPRKSHLRTWLVALLLAIIVFLTWWLAL